MSQHEATGSIIGRNLLEDRQHEDSCLPHARIGLTYDVGAENRLRNDFKLDLRGVFESTIGDSTQDFWLQEEVLERSRVHSAVSIN